MKYGIVQNNQLIFIDENKTRLVKTLSLTSYSPDKIQKFSEDEICQGSDGNIYLKGFEPQKSSTEQNDEILQLRRKKYHQDVDVLTAQITRLRDEEITENIAAQINQLQIERRFLVAVIKTLYPYIKEVSHD